MNLYDHARDLSREITIVSYTGKLCLLYITKYQWNLNLHNHDNV